MAWSGDFKRRRFEELNHMKIKDKSNYTMCSEYQYVLNGIADPTMTHNFSKNYQLKTKDHRRRYARHHDFMQTKMADLKTKPMYGRSGVLKDHKCYANFPSCPYDTGDDAWKYQKQSEKNESPNSQKAVSYQIKVNNKSGVSRNEYFAEKFRRFLASQLLFDYNPNA